MGGSRLLFLTHERVTIHLEIARNIFSVDCQLVLAFLQVFAILVDEATI